MSRTRAIEDAAAHGATFVKYGLLTHRQLDCALEAVAQGKNFEAYILDKEWVTEEEVVCIREKKDPNGNGACKGSRIAKQATVSMNRMEAHQEELIEATNEFHSYGLSLLESVADDDPDRGGVTEPLWMLPEEMLPMGIIGEEE